jgi:hypothetical protein
MDWEKKLLKVGSKDFSQDDQAKQVCLYPRLHFLQRPEFELFVLTEPIPGWQTWNFQVSVLLY